MVKNCLIAIRNEGEIEETRDRKERNVTWDTENECFKHIQKV